MLWRLRSNVGRSQQMATALDFYKLAVHVLLMCIGMLALC